MGRPEERIGVTRAIKIDGQRYYVTANSDDDRIVELFVSVGKCGEVERMLADQLGIAISIGLKRGIPLEAYTSKMRHTGGGNGGWVGGRFYRSVVDWLGHWLEGKT